MRAITFPLIPGTKDRRNAETGIEIRNDGAEGYTVRTFHADKGDMFESFRTLAQARTEAVEQVELMRSDIAEAYAEAAAEDASRVEIIHHITRYSREISCGATGPVRVEETARLVTCEACVTADDAKRMAEAERQAYAEDAERGAASAQTDAWVARHETLGTDTSGQAYAAIAYREADHDEAAAEDARRSVERDGADALIHFWTQMTDLSACGVDIRATPYTYGSPEWDEVTCNPCRVAYDRYAVELKTELGKWSRSEAPYDEAAREQAKRDAAQVIAASRETDDARLARWDARDRAAAGRVFSVARGLPEVPADLDDDAAWAAYCAAMPQPTDRQIADVLAEFGDPYAAARADVLATYKDSARALWQIRTSGAADDLSSRMAASFRASLRTLRGVIEMYDILTESWRMEVRTGSARDSFSQTFGKMPYASFATSEEPIEPRCRCATGSIRQCPKHAHLYR